MRAKNFKTVNDDGFVQYTNKGTLKSFRDGWIDIDPKKYIVDYLEDVSITTQRDLKDYILTHHHMLLKREIMKTQLSILEKEGIILRVDDLIIYIKKEARKLVQSRKLVFYSRTNGYKCSWCWNNPFPLRKV